MAPEWIQAQCAQCGAEFDKMTRELTRRFCSRKCARVFYWKGKPKVARAYVHVRKSNEPQRKMVAAMKDLRNEGMTLAAVGALFGVTKQAVHGQLKKYGGGL